MTDTVQLSLFMYTEIRQTTTTQRKKEKKFHKPIVDRMVVDEAAR